MKISIFFRTKPFALTMAAMLLLLGSCKNDPIETTGNIVGFVRDSRTSEPLSGVNITINPTGVSIATGSDGRFEFSNVEAQVYTVLAKKVNYQAEQRSITVKPGEDCELDILLTPSNAELKVSHSSFNFGYDATTLSLNILNEGHAILDWQIDEDINWLSFSSTSGKIQAGESSPIVLRVNREMLQPGTHTGTFAISSNGGIMNIPVNISVRGLTVSVSPDRLDFGYVQTDLMLTLKNNGKETETYTISTSDNWITAREKSGSLIPSESKEIKISINRTLLSEAEYSGHIITTVGGYELKTLVDVSVLSTTKPSVHIYEASSVAYSSAIFKATMASVGSSKVFRHGFCWSKQENPTIDNNPNVCDYGECTAPGDFLPYRAEGLEMSTRYYVRAYAENNEGISYSKQMQFVTLGLPSEPTVSTGEASNIQAYQADFSGSILNMGNVEAITQYGHVWSIRENPTLADQSTTKGEAHAAGPFVSTLTNLHPNVKYYVRAYATNEIGTAYGETKTFTTAYADVQLSTATATNITSKSAVVSATISNNGGHTIVERGVCWSTSSTPTLSNNFAKSSTQENNFSTALSGLSELTTYYARAYVKTAYEDKVFYGNTTSFTTTSKEVDITIDDCGEEQYWNK